MSLRRRRRGEPSDRIRDDLAWEHNDLVDRFGFAVGLLCVKHAEKLVQSKTESKLFMVDLKYFQAFRTALSQHASPNLLSAINSPVFVDGSDFLNQLSSMGTVDSQCAPKFGFSFHRDLGADAYKTLEEKVLSKQGKPLCRERIHFLTIATLLFLEVFSDETMLVDLFGKLNDVVRSWSMDKTDQNRPACWFGTICHMMSTRAMSTLLRQPLIHHLLVGKDVIFVGRLFQDLCIEKQKRVIRLMEASFQLAEENPGDQVFKQKVMCELWDRGMQFHQEFLHQVLADEGLECTSEQFSKFACMFSESLHVLVWERFFTPTASLFSLLQRLCAKHERVDIAESLPLIQGKETWKKRRSFLDASNRVKFLLKSFSRDTLRHESMDHTSKSKARRVSLLRLRTKNFSL